jgi:ABC-2 type transport system permease protein
LLVHPFILDLRRRFASMRGLLRLTVTEFKLLLLLLRDTTALFVVLALPIGFLLVFGSMVSGGDPSEDPRASKEFFSAMAVSISLGMLALFTIPTYLGTYREKGILRRLSVTPVHPATLLVAQLAVHAAMALAAFALAVGLLATGVFRWG